MNNVPNLRFKEFSEDWENLKISETLKIKHGKDQKKIQVEDGIYPILATGGEIGRTNTPLYDKESVLIGRKGTIDKPIYMNSPFWTVDTLFYSEIKNNMVPKFIFYRFQNINWRKYCEASGVPSLSASTIEGIRYNVPQKQEQEKIASFFSLIDKKIELQTKKVEELKNYKKGIMQKMFPRNGETVPELRFAGFTNAWEQCKLGDKMCVTSVKRIMQSDWTNSGVRFLRARDIVSASKNEEPVDYLYISESKYEEYSSISGKVSVGDLLVTGVGTIGIPYLITNSDPIYFKDGNIIWFKNEGKIDGHFFFYSFGGKSIQSFIRASAGTGTVGTYTIDSGKKTPILLPTYDEQIKIGEFFKQLDNLITLHQCKLGALNEYKKGLLQQMFI